jgi:MFS family permease
MQNAAIPYAVFEISGKPAAVGTSGLFQYLPFMVMGAIGGTLADRYARRRLLIVTQALLMVTAFGLWLLVRSDSATVASITAVAFVAGLLGGLTVPVWQAFVADLVGRDQLLAAVTLNSTQFNAARALGPFLAGLVIATGGVALAFLVNAVSFVAVLGTLALIRSAGNAPVVPEGGMDRLVPGLVRAARYMRSQPAIVACCISITVVAGLGSPLFNFLVVYGDSIFGVESFRLGILLGAAGIGSLVFAPLFLNVAPRLPRAWLLAGSMATYGVATALVGLSPGYWFAVAALMAFGGSYLGIASTINTTIQLVVTDDLRGKVLAIYVMFLTGSLPIGLFVWGLLADSIGLRQVTVCSGLLLLAATVALWAGGSFKVMAQADRARDAA